MGGKGWGWWRWLAHHHHHTEGVSLIMEEKVELKVSEENANKLLFRKVCDTLDFAAGHVGGKKEKVFERLLSADLKKKLNGHSPYPYIRLLLPDKDDGRQSYGIKEHICAKLYCDVIGLDRKSEAYDSLRFFSDPVKNKLATAGDFGATLEQVLLQRCDSKPSSITVGQVNGLLDSLALAKGEGERKNLIGEIFDKFSPREQKWLVRIIFHALRVGINKGLLKRLHPDAESEYDKTSDLRRLCNDFANKSSAERSSTSIQLGTPFTPMLSLKRDFQDVVKSFAGNPFVMEVKLDGERMLCHKRGETFHLFTRNCRDYTHAYSGALKEHFLEAISVENCVLDGEILSWNSELGCMVPFGSNRTVAKEESKLDSQRQLFYVVFDVLYVQGDGAQEAIEAAMKACRLGRGLQVEKGLTTGLPLDVRRSLLRMIVKEVPRRVEIAECEEVWDGSEEEKQKKLDAFFHNVALLRLEEGLVVKRLDSPYRLGENGRKEGYWVKLKPDYGDTTPSLDLLALGGYYATVRAGSGRAGLLTSFLCGIRKSDTGDDVPRQFLTCGRVGTGFDTATLKDLDEKLRGRGVVQQKGNLPEWVKPGSGCGPDWPDRWIRPEDSFVLEVKAYEMVRSESMSSGFYMRFPRVIRVRSDKAWQDADDERIAASVRAAPRQINSSKGGAKRKGQRGLEAKAYKRKGVAVAESFLFDTSNVVAETAIFLRDDNGRPYTMCVIGDSFQVTGTRVEGEKREESRTFQKSDIERIIKTNGGVTVATWNPSTTDFVIVGASGRTGQLPVQAMNILKHNSDADVDIVDAEWVIRCADEHSFIFPDWNSFHYMKRETRAYFDQYYDDFGDHYTQPTNPTLLAQTFRKMGSGQDIADTDGVGWQDKALLLPDDESTAFDVPGLEFWRNEGYFYVDMYRSVSGAPLQLWKLIC